MSWIQVGAAKHPDRIAMEGPERSLTYSELWRAAIGVAGALRRLGVRSGERVALALGGVEDFVVALHGCVLAGAVAVPGDLRLTEEERLARTAGARVVLSELPAPAPVLWPEGLGWAGGSGGAEGFGGSGGAEGYDEDPAVAVMHTSGTTAAPKQVVLSYGNWLASALGSAVALGLDPAERWLCPMPLTHVGGLSIPIRSSIYATTAVVHGRFDTEAVLTELMDPDRRTTLVSLVPTMLSRLLDAGLSGPPTLRWALLGGGPIPPALLERARGAGVPVAPTYGMTEACSQIATFGWPLPGAEIRTEYEGEIRTSSQRETRRPSDGEVLVRGPMVSAGALSDRGWLHTGDLGRFDDRGRLMITGRKADTIVSGGENVAPAEVEAVLLSHPAVADAAVHARPDPEWGEAVIATVVARDGATVEPGELRALCAARLAAFKVPKAFEFAPALPRSETGKLRRRELG
jgi:o-succinylbenzoate---CoA ligase